MMRHFRWAVAGLLVGSLALVPTFAQSEYIRQIAGGLLFGPGNAQTVLFGTDGKGFLQITTAGAVSFINSATVTLPSTTFTGVILGPDGTAAAPTYSFSSSGSADNGMFLSAANALGWSSGGTERLTLTTTGFTSTLPNILPSSGTASATSLNFGTANTGGYGDNDELKWAVGGTEWLVLAASSLKTTAPITSTVVSLATTPIAGFSLSNSTAAAAGAQQVSPNLDWYGNGWKTNATAASQLVGFGAYVLPVEGAANPTGIWRLQSEINAAARTTVLEVTSAGVVNALSSYQTNGNQVGYSVTAYAVGTAYAFTNTAAAIDVGTTDPAIVLDKAGTYQICGQVNLAYTGATVVAETATIKVRRTNNTPADLSAVVVLDLPVSTTLTHTYGIFSIPCFMYTTTATDDAVTLFGNVSAALGAGTIDATAIGTSIVAIRLY